jgi:hypothetical protein
MDNEKIIILDAGVEETIGPEWPCCDGDLLPVI